MNGVKLVANYLMHENQLIVWPALQERLESDLFQANVALRARYDMTNKELLDACKDLFQLDKEKNYRLFLIRADKENTELELNQTLAEAGIRNGDPLMIAGV
jgi:hypothetical protein